MSKLEKFDDTLRELEQELVKLRSASTAFQQVQEVLLNLSNNLILLQQLKEELEQQYQQQADLLEENFDQLKQANKAFYTDQEKTLRIKLDSHQSEIKLRLDNQQEAIKDLLNDQQTHFGQILKKRTRKIFNSPLFFAIVQLLVLVAVILLQMGYITV